MAQKITTWIALLGGVNVGGKNKLPMKELASEIEALGFENVRTYIQSGNVVFRSPRAKQELGSPSAAGIAASIIAASIAGSIKNKFGFQPGVIVLSKEELTRAAASNPYAEAENELEGRALHLFFLDVPLRDSPPKMDARSLDAVKRPTERWQVVGSIFYLHAPEGFGTSKLAARAERCLGVPATARNWRTVSELLKLAGDSD
jgi:uncharacterized protein (DUF1697 family)